MSRLLRLLVVAFSTAVAVSLLALWLRSVRRLDAVFDRPDPKSLFVLLTYPNGLSLRRVVYEQSVDWNDSQVVSGPAYVGICLRLGWSYRSGEWEATHVNFAKPDVDFSAAQWASPYRLVPIRPESPFRCVWQRPSHWWHGFGYERSSATGTPPGGRVAAVYIPFAVVVPVLLLPLTAAITGVVRRRRRRSRGRCPTCGYDLRGSPARCPECGAVTPLAAAAAA